MNGDGTGDGVAEAVAAKLPSGAAVRVEAVVGGDSGDGMTSVGLRDKDLDLSTALDSVGEIGSLVVSKLKQARPSRATVELRFGFAVESGKLTALWVGGKGEASLAVTLEWSGESGATGGPVDDAVRSAKADGAGRGNGDG